MTEEKLGEKQEEREKEEKGEISKKRIKDLEKALEERVRPAINQAVKKTLGVNLEQIGEDITDKLKNPLLGIEIDTNQLFKSAKKKFKKAFLTKLLRLNWGNISAVAKIAEIDRKSIHRIVDEKEVRKIRQELPKPYYVKREETAGAIESVLDQYKTLLQEKKLKKLYAEAEGLSEEIVEELMPFKLSLKEAEKEFEKEYLRLALAENDFQLKKTAQKIGLRPETLSRKLKELGIKKERQE